MSDLQLGLIVIGVVIVAGVYAFNRWQERQLHRRVEQPLMESARSAPSDPDVRGLGEDERVEPHFNRAGVGTENTPVSAVAAEADASPGLTRSIDQDIPAEVHTPIDYLCTLNAPVAIPYDLMGELVSAAHTIGKRVTLKAWNDDSGEWRELSLGEPRAITRVAIGLQLADRSGPVNRVQLSTMRDLLRHLAERVGGEFECPDIDSAAQAAADLDQFCAEVDISVGCNIVPHGSPGLAGTKLRGLLESAGYVLEADGKFWLHADDGKALMRAEDAHGKPLSVERLRNESLSGLTLSMDVPNAPANGRLFERMVETAKHLAHALDAAVVDDNGAPLTEPGLKVIRQQLYQVQAALQARGIAAGSDLAARLFS